MTTATDMPCRIPTEGTQCHAILRYMQGGKRLTVGKALMELRVYALSQRIGELKLMGWPIQSRIVSTGGGARVAEYWL